MELAIIMAVAALAPVVGDLIGKALSSGDTAKAQQLAQQAIQRYNIKPPDIAAMTAHLQSSQLAQAKADPESIAAQRGALASLKRYGEADPNDIELRAGTDAAARAANQQASGQNLALEREMQSRGMGNSGTEYATRALGNQAAAERSAAGGFAAAADSKRNALQSLQAYGGLAGEMRGQSFNEAATTGAAADATARFNEENRVKGAEMDWQNRFGLAGAQAGADMAGANFYNGTADKTQQQWQGYGQGVGQAAGALGGAYLDSQRKKPGAQSGAAGRYGAGETG